MLLEVIDIPLAIIEANTGQIEGLPANPRTVKSGKFRNLMKSIKQYPEMLHLREIIVYPINSGKKFVAIAGNQRRAACIELGHHLIRCKVLRPDTDLSDLKAIAVLDNSHAGEWSMDDLSGEGWNIDDLKAWNLDLPSDWGKVVDTDGDPDLGAGLPSKPVVKMEILFDDLDYYQHCKERLKEFLNDYPGIEIVEPKSINKH